jgi:hypothetical protein
MFKKLFKRFLKNVPDSVCKSCIFYVDGECLDSGSECKYTK